MKLELQPCYFGISGLANHSSDPLPVAGMTSARVRWEPDLGLQCTLNAVKVAVAFGIERGFRIKLVGETWAMRQENEAER